MRDLFGRKVGFLSKDKKVFFTYRKYPIHFFRKGNGWAISKRRLELLVREGIERIEVKVDFNGKTFIQWIEPEIWWNLGCFLQENVFESQICLDVDEFKGDKLPLFKPEEIKERKVVNLMDWCVKAND